MDPAIQPVREAISRITFREPDFPIVPNASGKLTTQPLALRDLLSRHLSSAVKWDASLRSLAESGITVLIEAGPGDVLAKLARRAIPGADVRTVGSPAEARAVAEEIRQPATGSAPVR
jgi:[acyl-carrier-protein] S-malonyltransferase